MNDLPTHAAWKTKETQFDLVYGNCVAGMSQLSADSVDIVVTSPPYNLGKEYESRLHLDDYLKEQREVIAECVRVLADGGSICWQVGNFVDNGAIERPYRERACLVDFACFEEQVFHSVNADRCIRP